MIMGYKYLLFFCKGWSGVAYAKGGLKVASRHLSLAFLEFQQHFLQVGNFLSKKQAPGESVMGHYKPFENLPFPVF